MDLWVSDDLGEIGHAILGGNLDMLDAHEPSLGDRTEEREDSSDAAPPRGAGARARTRDCLGAYLAAISRTKLLNREQEVALARAGHAGDAKSRERLIAANLRL